MVPFALNQPRRPMFCRERDDLTNALVVRTAEFARLAGELADHVGVISPPVYHLLLKRVTEAQVAASVSHQQLTQHKRKHGCQGVGEDDCRD